MGDDRIFIFRLNILLKRPNTADLTAPRSTMKQSPLLKLAQARGTSVARTVRLPLMWKSRRAVRSLVTTCWNPDATPPAWEGWKILFKTFLLFLLVFPFINPWLIFILRPIATLRSWMPPNTCCDTTSPLTTHVCEKHKVLCTVGRYWSSRFYLTQIVNKKTDPRFALWSLGNIFSICKYIQQQLSVFPSV